MIPTILNEDYMKKCNYLKVKTFNSGPLFDFHNAPVTLYVRYITKKEPNKEDQWFVNLCYVVEETNTIMRSKEYPIQEIDDIEDSLEILYKYDKENLKRKIKENFIEKVSKAVRKNENSLKNRNKNFLKTS